MIITPAIDLLDGNCVRLKQGKYSNAKIYSENPLNVLERFAEAGIRRVHIVDLNAAKSASTRQLSLIKDLIRSRPEISFQIGGGVRSLKDAQDLYESGVSRVIINTLALTNPKTTRAILSLYPETVLAADFFTDGQLRFVALKGWTEKSSVSVESFVETFPDLKNLLCTDISRDGMLDGPSTDYYQDLRKKYPRVNIIASGGLSKLDDIFALKRAGIQEAVLGKALYENQISLDEVVRC